MKTKLTLVIAVILIGTLCPVFGQWERHNIDASVDYTCFVDVDDIDNDGDMDVLVTEYGANMIRLYENDNLTWTMHDIGYFYGVVGLDIADFDNNDTLDVVAAAWRTDAVAWYKNNGGDPITWTQNIIDNTLNSAEPVHAKDLNGDGAPDVVAMGSSDPSATVWYENNLPTGWIKHVISQVFWGYGNMFVEDINNDDKPDIVIAPSDLNKVILFINNLPDVNWTVVIIDEYMAGTFGAHIADIDNDGDMDIAATAQNATGSDADVAWYENDGTGQTWTKHTICTDLLKARCLYIEDIDSNGYMDVLVTDLDADDVILFINEDGGQNWTEFIIDDNYSKPNVIFAYDIDLDGDFDIFPSSSARTDNALVWYENNWINYAYAHSPEVYPLYNQSISDTLIFRARVFNPENHTANVHAVIQGDYSLYTDNIQLFDDGLHSDNDSSDNTWANIRLSSELPEDLYTMKLVTHDSILDTTQYFHRQVIFTTIGPVTVDYYTLTGTDIEPNPGDRIRLELTLKNNGSTLTAANIEAKLISPDTLINIPAYSRAFGDIAAGENATSDNIYIINISEECPVNTQVDIAVDITSNGYKFWTDTFSILVQEPTSIEDIRDQVARIYPNPANDIVNIEVENPDNTTIEIYTVSGRLVFSKKLNSGTGKIDISGLLEGMYFVKFRQENNVSIEKLIVY